ncbi:MAG: cupin [Methyloversatilis sp. 12-65-5]|nr:MAG: cupin [Methyloversatilis sp. 12-65-5]
MSGNLYAHLPVGAQATERIDTLCIRRGVRIERIVSTGQSSPPGFWYDQPDDEWVALLSGSAALRFADEDTPRALQPGDWIFIPAHRRHRVEQTDADVASVWLAVHVSPPD